MYSDLFEKALKFVLEREGGYVNNPNDPGGATNKGITQVTYNKWLFAKGLQQKSVKLITDAEVKEIYYNNYWLAAKCDKMTPKFAVVCFDTAVNCGVGKVNELLKACQWNDLEVFFLERIRFYNNLANKANFRTFLHGWLNRVYALIDYVNKL